MTKNPEDYLMRLGTYAYDPFQCGNDVHIRIAHRGNPFCVAVVQVVTTEAGYTYEFISSSMPKACVDEFAPVLQRSLDLLVRCCLDT